MTTLQIGDKAPAFTLQDQEGNVQKLSEYKGKWVVLFFYPKDDTPGCTIETKEFTKHIEAFTNKGTVVFGISADSKESHCRFIEKFTLKTTLLTDTEHHVAQAYGVWKEKSMFGKKYWGIERSTFIINPEQKIYKALYKVNPLGHAKKVLSLIADEQKA